MTLPWSVRVKIQLKTAYKRITLNRLTTAFFIFGFVHCFAQGLIHSFIFTLDGQYSNLLNGIVQAAGIPPQNHTFTDGSKLFMCDFIPHTDETCFVLYDSTVDISQNNADIDPVARGQIIADGLATGFQMLVDSGDNSGDTSVIVVAQDGDQVTLDGQCTSMLLLPQQQLQNFKREDLTWVFLQFWLFFISLAAMIFDSVPHVLAVLGARVLATAWSAYAIYRTELMKQTFFDLIEQPGTPCSVELFSVYNQTRLYYEIPDLILNLSALGISIYLSWTLLKVYNSQSFKCMGAPEAVVPIYKYFMAVQACLHLECFVLLTAMGLWVDQLFTTYIHFISQHTAIYEASMIFTTVLLLPWITMGYIAIQREMKLLMSAFLFFTFVFISGWAIMFYSDTYRWSFVAWPNLGCYIVASFILLTLTMILGIKCWRNFGNGLAQYLHAESVLAASDFKPSIFEHDIEKGLSYDPPPLTKVIVSPSVDKSTTVTHVIPSLLRSPTSSHSDKSDTDSIASFYPEPLSPVKHQLRGGKRLV